MDLSRFFSFFTNSRNHSEQKSANLPIPTSSRDPYFEKLCASHSSGEEVEGSGNPERVGNGHLERFCCDCKFYSVRVPNPVALINLGNGAFEYRCSEGKHRNLVTGEPETRDCTIRRNASHDECGPEGHKWEPKP